MRVSDYYKFNVSQETLFEKYTEMLIEWNNKINLTSITDRDEIELKHYIDSLSIEKYIKKEAKLIDIGTGAGFPGIPLKIYREDLNVTLLDSLNKRINFLQEVIKQLDLKDIKAIHGRAEDCAHDKQYREVYDVVTTRAVANLSTLAEYMLPFCKKEGICICMKGPNIEQEVEEAKNAITILGGKIEKIDSFCLQDSDIERTIIIIKKEKSTEEKYPRKAGTPAKQPLSK